MLGSGCPRGDSLSAFCILKSLSSLASLLLGGSSRWRNVLMLSSLCLMAFLDSSCLPTQSVVFKLFLWASLLNSFKQSCFWLLKAFPLLLFLWELDIPIYPGSKSQGCRPSRWLMLFLTRRAHLSGSCVRFNRRKSSCDPVSFFGCLSNTPNIGWTSCVFWMVTFASIHSAELFAKEKLARFPA